MGDEEGPRCIVSDPAHPHNVSRRDNYKVKHNCFSCGKNDVSWELRGFTDNFHYYCTICDVEFHRRCLQIPSKMIHPYHPQHPLTFTFVSYETKIIVDVNYGDFCTFLCRSGLNMPEYLQTIGSKSNIIFDKCTLCGNVLSEWFYRCSICNFFLDFRCARNFPPLTIQNPRRHHHSLALFRRPVSFPCDACGLINLLDPSYACHQCDYMVHKSCVDLPRVIKITRHPHRLSHTPHLPTKVSLCRVCYKHVDIKYGQYSCTHEGCTYVVHSKCATHRKIWNWGELEWAPEEPDETEAIAPFKKVGDGLIQHFCHHLHILKLEKYDRVRDSAKQCQACMRPISSQDFYNCMECDFFLHEVCANLPRKLEHALHHHPLFVDPYPLYAHDCGNLACSVCFRKSSGLMYRCREEECVGYEQFQLDLNCVLVPEYFTHKSHAEHHVFISPSYSEENEALCQGCKKRVYNYHLHCSLCEFVLCYECATIPNEIHYKFDEHSLTLSYGESGVDDKYWCEVCEKGLDPTEWFYINKESCTTIHHKCLFGDSGYMKPGHIFDYCGNKVEVVGNGSSSRPICLTCQYHCPHHVCFKVCMIDGTEIYFCAFSCIRL
ncbi:DC1 [Arabidopsis suecica]|uniref:DC1 n=1 Tax=Arabidopsis suecica TaxID=45249 RepID=A0A8T2FKE6_ARASU|nr:DC1 [Arabidopsis suecica]